MAKTLRFAPIAEEHLEAVLAIEKEVNGSPWGEPSFRNEIDGSMSQFFVALLNGEVIGYGGCWIHVDEAHITNMAIRTSDQGNGYGKKLLRHILDAARKVGATCATLEVRASNQSAIKLYAAHDFVECGVRKGYYTNNKEDALVMWRHDL